VPQHWYLKVSDRISGPIADDELQQQAADGRLVPDAWVSPDRQNWVRADRLEGLAFPASGEDRAPIPAALPDDQGEGEEFGSAVEPANPADVGGEGLRGAEQAPTGKAEQAARKDKVRTKLDDLVASAQGLGGKASAYARSEEARARVEQVLGNAKEATSRAKAHASNATRRVKEAAAATIPFWRKLLHEVIAIVIATTQFTARLLRYGYSLAQTPILRRGDREARLALGRRMYEVGLGDEAMRNRITTLEDRFKSIKAAKGSTRTLDLEKKGLLIRLAVPTPNLETAPPGLEAVCQLYFTRPESEDCRMSGI